MLLDCLILLYLLAEVQHLRWGVLRYLTLVPLAAMGYHFVVGFEALEPVGFDQIAALEEIDCSFG